MSLRENNLVFGTQGNASGLDREKGLVVIKPSGVNYKELKPSNLVTVNLEGEVVKGSLKPSVDLPHHLYLYKNMPEIEGVVHTHSAFATMFAIAERPIPCFSTAHADVFGKEIPLCPYADNKGDHIGEAILKHQRKGCAAILLAKHGVFTFAETPQAAAKEAILVEYVAKSSLGALLLAQSEGKKISPMPTEEIKKWYDRYHGGGYGQK